MTEDDNCYAKYIYQASRLILIVFGVGIAWPWGLSLLLSEKKEATIDQLEKLDQVEPWFSLSSSSAHNHHNFGFNTV